MDFWEVLKVVVRRWIVVVPVLVLTAIGVLTVPPTIQPTYTATGTTVVVAPVEGEPAMNPYLVLGATVMAQSITMTADAPTTKSMVADTGNSPDYTVSLQNQRQPIVVVTAEAPQPDVAVATVEQVLELIDDQLESMQAQAGAVREMMYTTRPLSTEIYSTPVYDGAQRVRFVLLGVGILLAVGLAVMLEGIAVLRRRRRIGEVASMPTDQQLRLLRDRMDLLDERERLLDEREQLLGRTPVPTTAASPSALFADDAAERQEDRHGSSWTERDHPPEEPADAEPPQHETQEGRDTTSDQPGHQDSKRQDLGDAVVTQHHEAVPRRG